MPFRWAFSSASAMAAPSSSTVVERQGARLEPGLERAARHVLHDQEVGAVLRGEVEDGGDARVRQAGEHPRLAAEALARGGVVERARGAS